VELRRPARVKPGDLRLGGATVTGDASVPAHQKLAAAGLPRGEAGLSAASEVD
jgi:hypothetical protein